MNADNFRSGASNPRTFLHINNGKGLNTSDYAANGIHFLGGTYPNNGGFIEATENLELIAEGSAWYNGPGTYTFEYRLLVDDGVSGCQRTMRSTPVTVIIGNTIGNLSTSDCSILTNILTLLQSTSAITSTTPIRFQGIFRINADKFQGGAVNPRAVAYINNSLISNYVPSGLRSLGGTYPNKAGFIEAIDPYELLPQGSAWYKGPGSYTIEYGLIVDNGNTDCQRSVRSIPVTVRIDEPTTTSNITFSIAPNPTSNDVQIDVTVSKGTAMQCELYDIAGRKVMNVFEGTYSVGKLTFKVSLSNLPQGTYFCKITTSSETIQQKIQLIR
jgi:hypothetical protein